MIAAEVAEHGFASLKAPIKQVTALDATMPYSEPMEASVLPDEDKIVDAVRAGARARRPSPAVGPRRVADAGAQLDAEHGAARCCATMWRIRCFEERVARLKRADEVYGLIHLSIGGEGVAAAVCGQLRDDDAVYSGHRAHGHAIAKGAPLDRVMAELMGARTALCQGLGGSMHLVDVEHGLMGATGVVGGNIPLALGQRAGGAAARRRPGRGRVLRRRRRAGRALQRVGQPRRAVGAAA